MPRGRLDASRLAGDVQGVGRSLSSATGVEALVSGSLVLEMQLAMESAARPRVLAEALPALLAVIVAIPEPLSGLRQLPGQALVAGEALGGQKAALENGVGGPYRRVSREG